MSRIDLPVDDWGLLLTPRFAGLGSPAQEICLALLGLVPILLLIWLYRYELRLVRPLAAVSLLLSRLVLVGLLWFITGWQPILARTEVEEIPGRVLVAVDVSGSMDITDPQRTPEEKRLLAQALKMGLDAEQVDLLTRRQIAFKVLSPEGMDLLRRLGKNHQVEVIAFDEQAWEIDGENFKLEPGKGEFTDLNQALLMALETSGKDRGQLLGMFLLTDGRHNKGDDPESRLKEFKDRKVPIYPVAIGGKKPPPDIAVVKLTAPANLLQKTPSQVSVEVKVTGFPAGEVEVELWQPGEEKPQSITIEHQGEESKTYVKEFPLRLEKVGTHPLTVKVKPAGDIKEITDKNNSQSTVVRVVEDKARVLLIDSEARWEYHYLANALLRDEAMKVDQVLFHAPSIEAIPRDQIKEAGLPAPHLPPWEKEQKQADPLLKYHCIILGDVAPEQLPLEDRERLARFVGERGGTLVLLAGKQSMPLSYLEPPPQGQEADPLARLLPVQELRTIKPQEGFSVALTHEGDAAPYLLMDENPAESAKVWNKLPRHYWGLIGKARPGAAVLAHVKPEQTGLKNVVPDSNKEDPQRDNALIVQQNYGFGRVIFVGLDSTWRWRYRKGDLYHHRFWGQLILWAASDQLLPAGNQYVRYGTKQPVYQAGEEVEIFARLEEAAPPLSPRAKVQARIVAQKDDGQEETFAVIPLNADGAGLHMFKGTATDLPAGKFRVELDIPELADKIKLPDEENATHEQRDAFVVLPTESKEEMQLAVDWALLDSLARQSGGPEALTPDRLDEVLERLNAQVIAREQHEERRPWQDEPFTWYVLGAFLTLLTFEWLVRKLAALP